MGDLLSIQQWSHRPGNYYSGQLKPRTQGTFRNESILVDRGHVVSLYCPDFGQQSNVF